MQVYKTVKEVQRRFPEAVPLLDPIQDMNITDDSFKKIVKKVQMLEDLLVANGILMINF